MLSARVSHSACSFALAAARAVASMLGLDVDLRKCRREIRQHKRIRLVRVQEGAALLGQVGASCARSSMVKYISSLSRKRSPLRVSW